MGRASACNVVLEEPWVFGTHFSIEIGTDCDGDEAFMVADRSSNGTWLNGRRLQQGVATPMFRGDYLCARSPTKCHHAIAVWFLLNVSGTIQ